MNSIIFEKLNAEPILVDYIEDENEPQNGIKPAFIFDGARYCLEDFIRLHENPWISGADYPEYIHGMEQGNYWSPLYIEIIGGEEVNVYRAAEEGSRE